MALSDPNVFANTNFNQPNLPSSNITPGVGMLMTPQSPTQNPAGGVGSTIQRLLGGNPQSLADLGSVISSFGQGQKADRVVQGNYTQDYDKLMANVENQRNNAGQTATSDYNKSMLDAQSARNRNEGDAMNKLMQTSAIQGRTSDYAPASIQLGGKSVQLPSFGFGPKASTPAELEGANTLQGEVLKRLGPDGSYMPLQFTPNFSFTPHDLDSYAKPGAAEKLSSYGGAITSGLGALQSIFGGGESGGGSGILGSLTGGAGSGAMSGIMGKAVPLAGAVTGGLGLMHNQGLGTNVMNGVTAGASLGSIVPGIGTAVGAGVGAAVGGLRSLGSIGKPSPEELAGRASSAQGIQQLGLHANPQQQAEAQNAGWKNPQDALGLIVVRDMLAKSGMDPAQANTAAGNYVNQIKQAEKAGPQAVQQALATITQMVPKHA